MRNIFNFIKRPTKPPSPAPQDSRIMWALYHPQQGFEIDVLTEDAKSLEQEITPADIEAGWTVQKVRVSLAEE